MSKHFQHDVLVIGSGAAGLGVVLRLDPKLRVAVIAKGPLTEGSSRYAQGGISAVLASEDSVDAHVEDTLKAGDGLCDKAAVNVMVEEGIERVDGPAGISHQHAFRQFQFDTLRVQTGVSDRALQ